LFTPVSDIDADLLKAYLYEAMELDEQAARIKREICGRPLRKFIPLSKFALILLPVRLVYQVWPNKFI
jgi:hypothetical protein